MNRNSNKTLLLLLDGAATGNNVRAWLSDKGLVAWAATDICHALEELSDFTVARRPDIVMLQVATLLESYDTLRSALEPVPGKGDVRVVALGNKHGQRQRDPFFADDLDELKTLICAQMDCSKAATN